MVFRVIKRNVFRYANEESRRGLKKSKAEASKLIDPSGDYYENRNGILLAETEADLRLRVAKGEGIIHFLDAGPGEGKALIDAEKIRQVKAYGWGVNPLRKDLAPKFGKRYVRRRFEEAIIPAHFHVIQSHLGLFWSENFAVAFENMLNSLRKGGTLYLAPLIQKQTGGLRNPRELRDHLEKYSSQTSVEKLASEEKYQLLVMLRLFDTLKKQGFSVPTHEDLVNHLEKDQWHPEGYFNALRIKRNEKPADLSEFYGHKWLNRKPVPESMRLELEKNKKGRK